MKQLKKHMLYYSISICIFVVALVLIAFTNYSYKLQLSFIVMAATLYFVWTMMHHYVHHQLHHRIVIEYALIITLGVVLSFFLYTA